MIVRRVEPFSAAKMGGMLYAILGLCAAVIITLFSSALGGLMGTSGAGMGAMFGVGSIILFPILYGVIGFIMTLLMAAIYNLAAKFVGGIEIQAD